ncbi:hypothetical protein CLU93_0817 [Janthinobacterium sp. 35]|uniref:hypothetical protein n=1 Tax=Janthinobacterium sp. 35 TaxID=2035210 RepID=UPI000C643DA3|nr:hypothetical protein [Janthinobacterium sp. 35]PIG26609.1 hypothetical protein CLU93_0817 [Janthinobacterium sp. 35]
MTSKSKEIYDHLTLDFPHALQPITTLSKNTSDKRDFVLSTHLAFNFDLIQNYCPVHPNQKEKSPDALFFYDDILYFVEFKEGDIKKDDVRLKIHEAIVSLFHYAISKNISTREEFVNLDIRYAIIMRPTVRGTPQKSFLDTLEASSKYFNLKNLEGLLIKKTKVAFQPMSILNLLNKITNGAVSSINVMNRDQTASESFNCT